MNFSAILNHWLHLISAVVWIGGLAYQVFILNPLIKPGMLPSKTLIEINKRFRRISLVSLIILITTGGINLGVRRVGFEMIPPRYITALGVKVFLVVGLAVGVVFGIVRSTTSDDDDESQTEEERSALPSFTSTKMAFAIGVIVIFIASMLRQWKF